MLRTLLSILSVLGSLSSVGCVSNDVGPPIVAPTTPELTVMTYNVNFGIPGDADSIDLIRASGADLVVLQETNADWETALVRDLGGIYAHHAFRPARQLAGGIGVLSKRPIEEKELVDSPSGWFPGFRVIADTPLGKVQVLDVHLRPQLSDQKAFLSGYFSTKSDRLAEIEAYAKTIDRALPALVVGDFNEGDGGSAIEYLERMNMRSALPPFAPSVPTWHWPTRVGEIHLRLDHILYDERAFSAIDARVVEGGHSDHYPVIARLTRVSSTHESSSMSQ